MQLEEGLRKREEHDEGKDRHSATPRGNSAWSASFHGAANYERWVKLIALGSLGLWMIFVLFFWHTGVAPVKQTATKTRGFNTQPSILDGFPESTNFIAFGDFGTGDENQRKVALALENFTATMDPAPAFVLSTGDQIYDHGIESANDPLLSTNFEQMYTHPKLQLPWYITIGNHDCEGSIDAMLQYAQTKNSLWYMPRRYYSIERPVAPKTILRLVVIDACDLVCGREPRDFRCTERMIEQSSKETRQSQYEWIEQTLSADKPAGVEQMWTIIMGHWGVYSFAGNADTPELIDMLDPILKKYKVHAYFNGHDHSMQHIRKVDTDGSVRNYFVSGAGGYRIHELQPNARANPDLVHAALTHGFMSVHMTQTYFRVQLVDSSSEILYTTDVRYK
ncbi:Tartrate-resistant acid phosphatase type 5 [Phytophthora palmivora]|uniref:Tartrate-resistant acid phosphatase type 5 n=1 Tax=Phytophthora palmivora TaxID=4796 RepID=A0A2P4X865_9STRA|nr:Tartrate-resistant acid phosphatase type 5 [Phytophthora palmivora]